MGGAHGTPPAGQGPRQRREQPPGPPLPVLVDLFSALEAEGVRYCHWKSTMGIPRGLAGLTDLDLLVDRAHVAPFAAVLERLAFKRLVSAPAAAYPGLEDHLGFDEASGRLAHLHVHFRLVLGAQHVKNHLLPIESAFLDSARLEGIVRVPAPALEAAVLAIRVLLKHRGPPLPIRRPDRAVAPGVGVAAEFSYLRDRYADAEMADVLARHLPFVSPDLLLETIAEAVSGRSATVPATGRSRRLRAELGPYERLGPWAARLRYERAAVRDRRVLGRIVRPILPPRRRKAAAGGGLAIAFVGSDGAGKSTVVREIAGWLSWRLDVKRIYMGTSQPSPSAALARAAGTATGIVLAGLRRTTGASSGVTRLAGRVHRVALESRHLAEARDRYRRFVAGRRLVGEGWVVLYDRYPLPGLLVRGRPIDGPRIATYGIAEADGGPPAREAGRAARAERRIYERIGAPDRIVLLRVSAATALARKPDHDPNVLDAKAADIGRLAAGLPGVGAVEVVDADAPLETVILEVKRRVWRML